MIKKAVKIELELILPYGFDEYDFLEDLQNALYELDYVDTCTAEVKECYEHVFFDIDALDDDN